MIKRKELHKLVIMTLEGESNIPASQIYQNIMTQDPSIFREEQVRSFRSFVKIINQFPEVEHEGKFLKKYYVK